MNKQERIQAIERIIFKNFENKVAYEVDKKLAKDMNSCIKSISKHTATAIEEAIGVDVDKMYDAIFDKAYSDWADKYISWKVDKNAYGVEKETEFCEGVAKAISTNKEVIKIKEKNDKSN